MGCGDFQRIDRRASCTESVRESSKNRTLHEQCEGRKNRASLALKANEWPIYIDRSHSNFLGYFLATGFVLCQPDERPPPTDLSHPDSSRTFSGSSGAAR